MGGRQRWRICLRVFQRSVFARGAVIPRRQEKDYAADGRPAKFSNDDELTVEASRARPEVAHQ
jgi:hypothetical protein